LKSFKRAGKLLKFIAHNAKVLNAVCVKHLAKEKLHLSNLLCEVFFWKGKKILIF